jgi:hypothetical protein
VDAEEPPALGLAAGVESSPHAASNGADAPEHPGGGEAAQHQAAVGGDVATSRPSGRG